MSQIGFEPPTPLLDFSKTVSHLHRAATLTDRGVQTIIALKLLKKGVTSYLSYVLLLKCGKVTAALYKKSSDIKINLTGFTTMFENDTKQTCQRNNILWLHSCTSFCTENIGYLSVFRNKSISGTKTVTG
jgi:hypothetical protein